MSISHIRVLGAEAEPVKDQVIIPPSPNMDTVMNALNSIGAASNDTKAEQPALEEKLEETKPESMSQEDRDNLIMAVFVIGLILAGVGLAVYNGLITLI